MAKELNEILIQDFRRRLGDMTGCVLIDYQGIDSERTTQLRGALRASGVRMVVIHNRLARRSLAEFEAVPDGFGDLLRGPTALLFGEDGALSASKVVTQWHKKNKGLAEIKGGLFEGKVLSTQQVDDLAKIPDKDTLRQQAAGLFASPLQVLAGAAQSLVTNFAGCAKARHGELGGEGE